MRTRNNNENNNYSKRNITETTNIWNADRDFMESFYDDKQQIHKTGFIQFAGITTLVTYFHKVFEGKDGNMHNNTATSSVAKETSYYDQINNFEIKLEESLNISNEGDDTTKNYIRSGNLKILPDTIIPYTGDFFIMKYLDSDWLFQIQSVNKEAPEMDSGFICEFVVENKGQEFNYDSWIIKDKIRQVYNFHAAHIGTDYKTILETEESKELKNLTDFYNYIGEMYRTLFYDRRLNIYTLKNLYKHDPENSQNLYHQVNQHHKIYSDDVYYDNFLNHFIKENNIFGNIKGKIVIPSVLAGFQIYDYYNTVFYALSNQDIDNLKYKFFCSEIISKPSIYIPTILYGMEYVKHVSYINDSQVDMLPKDFFNIVENFDFFKLSQFENSVYASDSYVFTEIIALYLTKLDNNDSLKRNQEIIKRLKYLYNRKHKLNIEEILPQYIYYMYPMVGYIINELLNKKFNKYNKEKI